MTFSLTINTAHVDSLDDDNVIIANLLRRLADDIETGGLGEMTALEDSGQIVGGYRYAD